MAKEGADSQKVVDLIKDDYNAFYCSPEGEIANTLKNSIHKVCYFC